MIKLKYCKFDLDNRNQNKRGMIFGSLTARMMSRDIGHPQNTRYLLLFTLW